MSVLEMSRGARGGVVMAITDKYLHYGSIESPAACPKCGSLDLTNPWQGRRTELWLARCRDCDTSIRSTTQFEVTARRNVSRYKHFQHEPQPMRPMATTLMAAAIRAGQPLQTEWLPYREREPGEEG